MLFGVNFHEILWLALAVVVAGVITGLLAGLFGVGGGSVIVPVLYEVFGVLDVPDEVRLQLCVGTSIAIIVPTAIRSYLTHRAKGFVIPHVIRIWTLPAVLGVGCGAAVAAFAPSAVFTLAFVVIASFIATKLLFAGDRWNLGADLPSAFPMACYGFGIGLGGSLMGVSGGALSRAYALRQADPQCGGYVGGYRCADNDRWHARLYSRRPATPGVVATVLARFRFADRVCRYGAGVELGGALWRASCPFPDAADARNRFRLLFVGGVAAIPPQPDSLSRDSGPACPRRGLGRRPVSFRDPIGHAIMRIKAGVKALLENMLAQRSFDWRVVGWPRLHSRIAAQQEPVAPDLPTLQPVEEAHAEEACLEQARLRHQRQNRMLDQAADSDPVERHRRCARAAVRGVDVRRVGEHFERQACRPGGVMGQHHGTRAGVEHDGDRCSVDLCRHVEVAARHARHLYRAPVCDHMAGHQLGQHAVGDAGQLESIRIANNQGEGDADPQQRGRDRLHKSLVEGDRGEDTGNHQKRRLEGERVEMPAQKPTEGAGALAADDQEKGEQKSRKQKPQQASPH